MTLGRRLQRAAGTFVRSRDDLLVGIDKPGPDTTGPYTVEAFEDVYPVGGASYITISNQGVYYGKRFWGQIRVAAGLADWSVQFRECHFVGHEPSQATSGNPEMIRAYGKFPSKYEIWDSLIDPSPWLTSAAPGGARSALSPYYTGIRGGNIRMYRSEIRNISDGWNWIGPDGDNGSAAGLAAVVAQEHLSQQNWYHKCYYANDVYPPSDGQPHADGIQTNFGRNFTSRGDFIGGDRVMTGFLTWPGGYNAGDDFYGAGVMIKQEVGVYNGTPQYIPAVHEITNFVVEDGWIEGCGHGVNHAYVSDRAASYAGSAIRRMKFKLRTGSDWGASLRGTGPGSTPVQNTTGPGTYIIRNPSFSGFYANNVLYDGSPTPINNGA